MRADGGGGGGGGWVRPRGRGGTGAAPRGVTLGCGITLGCEGALGRGGRGGGCALERPRPAPRIAGFCWWMSSAEGAVVKFDSLENSAAAAMIETDVGLGWNGTSGGSKSSSRTIRL